MGLMAECRFFIRAGSRAGRDESGISDGSEVMRDDISAKCFVVAKCFLTLFNFPIPV